MGTRLTLFFLFQSSLFGTLGHAVESTAGEELITAARKGDIEGVKSALSKGANVNAATKYGVTPLLSAADKGHVEVAKLLIERGANVNAKDTFYNMSALDAASYRKHREVVKLLIANGAEGSGPLLVSASSDGDTETVKLVLGAGKATEEDLSNALGLAMQNKHTEVIELLKAAGAKAKEISPALQLSAEKLQKYVGTYKSSQIGMEITFSVGDGNLKGLVAGQPTLTYAPKAEHAFEAVEFPGIKIVFNVTDGKVPGLSVEQAGQKFPFERAPEKSSDSPQAQSPESDSKGDAPQAEIPESTEAPIVKESRNWPSFRGVGATGVADGQGAPLRWDVPNGKNLAWRTAIPGLAHSCPVVWGDRVFVTTAASENSEAPFRHGLYGDVDTVKNEPSHQWKVYALDKKTGAIAWEKTSHVGVPKVERHTKSSHANSTPVTDGKHVVAMFGSEGLYCYDIDGKELWKRDLGILNAGWFFDPDYPWGFGSSPVMYQDTVIVQADVQADVQGQPHISALDVRSGATVWTTLRDEVPSWGTPTIYEANGKAEVLTNGTKYARGYDAATGLELWRLSGHSEITVPTPFVSNGLIFIASGYSPIQPIYAIKVGARGDLSLRGGEEKSEFVAWSKKKGGPYMPTPIAYGDHLYTCANNGILICYQAKTGEQVYKQRISDSGGAAFTASPIAADGKLFFTSEDGDVFVVRAGPTYELLATNPVGEPCMATPAISDGLIFIRTTKHIVAVGKPATRSAKANP
ncbi:MAG: PQQ-binding-like beta-propeller repeat protein [Planctomycetota bacterium]